MKYKEPLLNLEQLMNCGDFTRQWQVQEWRIRFIEKYSKHKQLN